MLAKISDAGAKANCYLSCFNDLLYVITSFYQDSREHSVFLDNQLSVVVAV
jgi:hypothetical protein